MLSGANGNSYPDCETRFGRFSYKKVGFQVEAVYLLQLCIRGYQETNYNFNLLDSRNETIRSCSCCSIAGRSILTEASRLFDKSRASKKYAVSS